MKLFGFPSFSLDSSLFSNKNGPYSYIKMRRDLILANYKEIVTKAVLGKGKKTFSHTYSVVPSCPASTVLGCWVINHTFQGVQTGDKITINGSFDVNIWYSCENDTSTEVIKERQSYQEVVTVRAKSSADSETEDIIVRSLQQPTCVETRLEDGKIFYTIEKELGVELVGDTKVKIQVDEDEEPWDSLDEEENKEDTFTQIDEDVNEDYLD